MIGDGCVVCHGYYNNNKTHMFRTGASGSVVVKALCYKPEGCGFETR
jgi:hypothetical protein